MRWRRIFLFSAALAFVAGAAVVAPLARDAWLAERARKAAAPHPILASDAELAAIARAIVGVGMFSEPPPPPPPFVVEEPERLKRRPWVVDRTLTLRGCGKQGPGAAPCYMPDAAADDLLNPEYYAEVGLRWRAELVLASQQAHTFAHPHPSGGGWISGEGVESLENEAKWLAFRTRHPDALGFLTLSRAVLSPDRREALVLVQFLRPYEFEGVSRHLIVLKQTSGRWDVTSIDGR